MDMYVVQMGEVLLHAFKTKEPAEEFSEFLNLVNPGGFYRARVERANVKEVEFSDNGRYVTIHGHKVISQNWPCE